MLRVHIDKNMVAVQSQEQQQKMQTVHKQQTLCKTLALNTSIMLIFNDSPNIIHAK